MNLTEIERRYILYMTFASRAFRMGNMSDYQRFIDSASFWYVAGMFGADVARKEYYGKQIMTQYLRERFRITEYKEGMVYKTKSLGYFWTSDEKINVVTNDEMWCSPSTHVMKELNFVTTRKIPDFYPDPDKAVLR